ncbi:MAG TPA: exonuclease SbcCD subunit D [Candidatus Nanoarchaeia archaeon]|nr:exonuclease SbcCD subunit D [Candidatus Nanoarchaeia archaeon]
MKYAHLADLHLGSWRDEKMRDLSTKAFLTAIDECIQHRVDFILFAGDLFNTSLPSLDTLKIVTKKMKELLDKNIPLYVIAGSHDFSPSGKTMIDVLQNAGLLMNVCKGTIDQETGQLHLQFTIDKKTNVKITGILGRKGLLDKTYYQNLHLQHLEEEKGYKIFMFHTTLTELKPKHLEMLESQPASFLPKRFNYYAGGHIHHPTLLNLEEYGPLTYTGALFPNNFAELEKYSYGGYYLIDVDENNFVEDEQGKMPLQTIIWQPLEMIQHQKIILNCQNKTPLQVQEEILHDVHGKDLQDTIITIRLYGKLLKGRTSDIDFTSIFEQLYRQNAYIIMKNTVDLTSEEFSEIKAASSNPETIEEDTIKEHLQQLKLFDKETEFQLTKSLLQAFNTAKKEGETITDFNQRVLEEAHKLLNI